MTELRRNPWHRRLGIVAAVLALAVVAGADADARREPYKPSRLWYRVTIEFTGERVKASSGNPQYGESRWNSGWKLRSTNAIALTLLCRDYRAPDSQPFSVRRKIRGRLVPVGGCAHPVRDGLRPTLRFASRATGEWTRYEYAQLARPTPGCSPGDFWRREQLISAQPLFGAISTPDSAGEGLVLSASPTAPFGTFLFQAWDCFGRLREGQSQIAAPGWLFGSEEGFANPQTKSRWAPLRRYLTFHFPVARFGKSFETKLLARQFSQPAGYPRPPAELGGDSADALQGKRYSYKLRFQPCPRGGLDVGRC